MIGKRVGPYEILEKLGQGGMGEVWRARDTALDREVAIKVLPELFARDAERLARFEREAKLLASLNHPAIAAVHGLHEQDGQRFLAMELVPGQDLAQRLSEGPLGMDQALFVGVQVAEALEAAHAQGVIHRDLKPANIMLTPGGKAKVLDFGLAKVSEPAASGSASVSPTVTSGGTADGVILGTAAYMSPEQARGRALDRRTDVWSFGCVLFECLTGLNQFRGETVSDTLGAILHKEPDWSLLPRSTPPTVRLLLRRCLTKDADKRLHDIADARIELQQAIEDPTSSSMGLADAAIAAERRGRGRSRWLPAAGAALALVLGLAAGFWLSPPSAQAPLRKLDLGVELTSGTSGNELALSPDGGWIAFTDQDQLWVQALDQTEPRRLEGTEGAIAPFWSPDGEEIGYFRESKLWRIPAAGGRGVAVCDVGGPIAGGRGADWGPDGRILFSRGNTGLLGVPALGGQPQEVVALAEDEGDLHEPHILPGGRGYLFVSHGDGSPGVLVVYHDGERRVLLDDRPGTIHAPTYADTGHILMVRRGGEVTEGLWALPFSLDRLEAAGEPFLVAPDAGPGSVTRDGTLAYVSRPLIGGRQTVVRVDRTGEILEPIGGERRGVASFAPSPDGRWLAVGMQDEHDGAYDLWVRDLERGTETRLTTDPGFEFALLWSPSGEDLYYSRFDPGGPMVSLHVVPADGSGPSRQILERAFARSLAPDGGALVISRFADGEPVSPSSNLDLWLLPLREGAEPGPLIASADIEADGVLSPDGRWLAYLLVRADKAQVYLTRFPEATGRWQVSVGEGRAPEWDPRGDRLYYQEGKQLMEVRVGSGDPPALGRPEPLFELAAANTPGQRNYAPEPGGEGFIVVRTGGGEDEPTRPKIKIVQSWLREFRK
ncbi:MAG: protein kinase [Acidobacteriota bacterium]|jgi:Tol biopolymer transport system component